MAPCFGDRIDATVTIIMDATNMKNAQSPSIPPETKRSSREEISVKPTLPMGNIQAKAKQMNVHFQERDDVLRPLTCVSSSITGRLALYGFWSMFPTG